MAQPRTRPPRDTDWETPNLRSDEPGAWLIDGSQLEIKNKTSWRLKDSLLTVRVIRLVRSTLAEFDPNKDEWQSHRYLGSGASGAAVLFNRHDEARNLVDEIVVKEVTVTNPIKINRFNISDGRYMAHEALAQNTLNKHCSDNLVHLRGYKAFFPNLPALASDVPHDMKQVPDSISRFYLEYAPYGTLYNLLARYKAFNRYLPELFLWHLFNSLAKAIDILDRTLPDGARDVFVAHFDIKPDNIFLGYETTRGRKTDLKGGVDTEAVGYPLIKLGDLDLAQLLGRDRAPPMRNIQERGTKYYLPPEMVTETHGQYGSHWTTPPNNPDDRVTTKINVWGVGKVMYDAFSLSEYEDFDRLAADSRLRYQDWDEKPIRNFRETPFRCDPRMQSSPYSKALSDLIELCMHVEPHRRPTPVQLYNETRRHMEAAFAVPEPPDPQSVKRRNLYYRGNKINDMDYTEVNCGKTLGPNDFFDLFHPANNDPEEPLLNIDREQLWDMKSGEEQEERKGAYYGMKELYMRNYRFVRHTHMNQERLGLNPPPGSIDVFDTVDQELTYHGTALDKFFIDESRRKGTQPPKYHDSDGDSDDDDDGDQSGGRGDGTIDNGRDGQGSQGAGPRKDDGATHDKSTAPDPTHDSTQADDQPKEALDNEPPQQIRQAHFSPYKPYKGDNRVNRAKIAQFNDLPEEMMFTNDPSPDVQLQAQVQRESQRKRPRRPTASEFWHTPPERTQRASTSRSSMSRACSVSDSVIFVPHRAGRKDLNGHKNKHEERRPRKRPRFSQVLDENVEVVKAGEDLVDEWKLKVWT